MAIGETGQSSGKGCEYTGKGNESGPFMLHNTTGFTSFIVVTWGKNHINKTYMRICKIMGLLKTV